MRVMRLVARTVGEVLLTAGGLCVLFVLWQLWWTDVQAGATADKALEQIQATFVAPAEDETTSGEPTADFAPGDGIAVVHLPTIDQTVAVQEGVGLDVLDRGVLGHYPHSALPGEVGNFAVAGHRTTWGRPLWDLASVKPNDPVVVETAEGWFVYAMDRHRIVNPWDTQVVAAVPDRSGVEPTQAWMVLTACHPKFSAAQRIVGYAVLDRVVPRDEGPPPELTGDA